MTWLKSLLMRQNGAHSNSLELEASANGHKSASELMRRPLKRKRFESGADCALPPRKEHTNRAGEEPTSVKLTVDPQRQQQQVRLMCEQARSQAIVDLAQTNKVPHNLAHEGGARSQLRPLLSHSELRVNMLNSIQLSSERPRRRRQAAFQDQNNHQIELPAGRSIGPSQSERLGREDLKKEVAGEQTAVGKENPILQRSNSTPHPSTATSKRTKRSTKLRILFLVTECLILSLMSALSGHHAQLAAAASSEQQYFEQQPEPSYWVSQGADVRLRCLVRYRQGDCAWLHNGKVVGNINRKYSFAKAPSDGDCSIQIKNASVALDDGHWQCQVLATDVEQEVLQTRDSQLVVLVQPEKPQLKNLLQAPGSSKLIVEENKPKIVTCEMRGGNPAPQIEWFLDGRNVTKEATQTTGGAAGQRLTQSKMRLADLKRTMNGKNLTCVGVHPTTNQSSAVELDVQYVPSVSVPRREYSIVEGSPLSILCQVDANPAPSLVNWRLVNDGSQRQRASASKEALLASKQGPILDFEHVTRDYNQNVFECLAQNSLGISSPTEVKLNVLYTPFLVNTSNSNSVDVNGEARLSCNFEGNPQPEIKWFYTDPLSRTPTALLVDSQQQQQQQQQLAGNKQHLVIRNVTYRNEGDYHCEARNSINGEVYSVRSSNIALDVFGEPQFLVGRAPLPLKAVQGQKSDIALTFCADPQPQRVYWQFGSIRLEVRSAHILGQSGGHPAAALQAPSKHASAAILQRFQVHGLEPLQKRDSSFSKVPTCFEASLSLLEPDLNDQRDYNLFVQSERGTVSGTVRLRVASPLSPALMITSAFVFIVVLFLLALLFLFVFKKRHQLLAGASSPLQPNGSTRANGSARRSANGRGAKESAINGKHPSGISSSPAANGNGAGLLQTAINGQTQQQAKGVVNGSGNGLANEAANPNAASLAELQPSAAKSGALHHGLMSMASSDTSCTNDQKQLLANCSSNSDRNSDRNSSAGSSTNGAVLSSHRMDFVHSNQTDRSSANSTPNSLPLHHISVDDEIQLNGSYQATESVTHGAQLSPSHMSLAQATGASNALIYANIADYSTSRRPTGQEDFTTTTNSSANNFIHDATSDQASTITMANTKRAAMKRQQTSPEQLGSASPSAESFASAHNQHQSQLQPDGRPSVGATIAMMNSLAAAASPTNPSGPATGVLNGAINQQLANRGQVRRPGPPKPPKPSIQQRSRFYQLQAAADGGLVMIGNSQLAFNQPHEINSNPTGEATQTSAKPMDQMSTNELAAEYSRLAFPARAEL